MAKKIVCVTGKLEDSIANILREWQIKEIDCFIGIDRGAWFLLQENFPLDVAIGDFDSLSEKECAIVQTQAKEFRPAPCDKDDTDTQLALAFICQMSEEVEVVLLGGLTGRLDHSWSILMLAYEERLSKITQSMKVIDKENGYQLLHTGKNEIPPKKGWQFGIVCLTPVENLSIKQAKYELETTNIPTPFVYACNEFWAKEVLCCFTQGKVAVVFSKKEEKSSMGLPPSEGRRR